MGLSLAIELSRVLRHSKHKGIRYESPRIRPGGCYRTGDATRARCIYGHIPEDQWGYPKWISPEDAAQARKEMEEHGVLYGSRESYHHMCRYFSGFIHKHPLLKEFDYYWRMEPDVHYYCDLDYDPFLFMQVCSQQVSASSSCLRVACNLQFCSWQINVSWKFACHLVNSRLWAARFVHSACSIPLYGLEAIVPIAARTLVVCKSIVPKGMRCHLKSHPRCAQTYIGGAAIRRDALPQINRGT